MNARVPKGLFSAGLDEIAVKLLKNTHRLPNEREMRLELARRGLAAAEALVLAPKVTFKVYGENVVLAILAKAIGPKGIRELLEEGGLEFILWQSFPVHWSHSPDKPAPKGAHPLAGITLTDTAHSDPFASAELGLRGWASWMLPSDAKPIARLAAEKTSVVDATSGDVASRRVLRAYEQGLLRAHGFDGTIPYDDMTEEQRSRLNGVASDLHRVVAALGQELSIHEDEDAWGALTAACSRLEAPERILEVAESIIHLERIPSISKLLLLQVLSHRDIPELRRRKETIEFRKWLWSQPDPTDSAKVSEAYLAAMAPKVDLKDKTWFKAARISVVGAIGSALGTVVAGPVGGVVAGAVASTAAGIATSMVDGFWLDALLTKPNPRRFATDVLAPIITARTRAVPPLLNVTETADGNERRMPVPSRTPAAPATDSVRSRVRHPSSSAAPPPTTTKPAIEAGERPTPAERRDDDRLRRERNKRKARRKAERGARRRNR